MHRLGQVVIVAFPVNTESATAGNIYHQIFASDFHELSLVCVIHEDGSSLSDLEYCKIFEISWNITQYGLSLYHYWNQNGLFGGDFTLSKHFLIILKV